MIGSTKNNTNSILINLFGAEQKQKSSMEKLASGRSINSFKDNPAAASISIKMTSQIGGIAQDIANSQTNVSLLQTKEAGLGEVQRNIEEIKTLQQSASNPAYGAEEKKAIQSQIDSVMESTKRTIDSTQFNDKELINPGENLKNALQNGLDTESIDRTDSILNELLEERSSLGSEVTAIGSDIRSKFVQIRELTASESLIGDTDMAEEIIKKMSADLNAKTAANLLKKSFDFQNDMTETLLN